MELTGHVALVTGAAKRLGRSIALALAEAGADVAVHFGRSRREADETVEDIRAAGRRAEAFEADLADEAQIAAMFERVGEVFGRLDVLVNSAAVFEPGPIESLTADAWDAQMAVNARAAALCIGRAVAMMDRGGAIVNITDIAASKAWGGYPAYCASKGALEALTRSCARALAGRERGIRVNAVAPGAILWDDDTSEERKQQVLRQVPMGRCGSAEDVAAAVVFLAGQDYITAQTLRVDGGWHMG